MGLAGPLIATWRLSELPDLQRDGQAFSWEMPSPHGGGLAWTSQSVGPGQRGPTPFLAQWGTWAENPNTAPGTTEVSSCLSVLGPLPTLESGQVYNSHLCLKSLCGLGCVLRGKGRAEAQP